VDARDEPGHDGGSALRIASALAAAMLCPRGMTLSFLLTTLIVVASPGTGVLYTLAVALAQGSRASVAAAFGCTLGIVPQMVGAMLGLAAILHTSALAFATLKWCGVAYLLYMAWQALRETGALAIRAEPVQRSDGRVIVTAVLINILNPKLSIFFFAFLPQFIDAAEAHPLARLVELSAVFMLMTFVVFAVYGLFAAAVRDRVISRPKVLAWLRRSFAAGFAALGARLALSER
jgi:threonine/homoserine/homoserine lactone efflux protein